MKVQGPQGMSGANIAGTEVTFDKKGVSNDIPDAVAKELIESHGCVMLGATKVDAAPPIDDKFTDMSRPDVIGYIKGKGIPFSVSADTEDLRALARSQYTPEERAADAAAAQAKADAAKAQ